MRDNRGHRDEAMALLVARGMPRERIAAELGVSTSTIQRRNRRPEFQARVNELRDRLIDQIAGRLADLGGEAVRALAGLLTSESEGVRLNAATQVLAFLLRVREQTELAARVASLEAEGRTDDGGNHESAIARRGA